MKLATIERYRELIADRPAKFSPAEVRFSQATSLPFHCRFCIHWYENPSSGFRVCEIMRPPNEEVPPDWRCMFWTTDSKHFPLLDERHADSQSNRQAPEDAESIGGDAES